MTRIASTARRTFCRLSSWTLSAFCLAGVFSQCVLASQTEDPAKAELLAVLQAPPQERAKVASQAAGFAVNTTFGKTWSVPEDMLDVIRQPKVGRYALVVSSCQSYGHAVSVLATQAQPGHTAKQAADLLTSPGVYKPLVPTIVKGNLSISEVEGETALVYSNPRPLGTTPSLTFLDERSPSRRSEIARTFPAIDLDCRASDTSSMSAKESVTRALGLPGLAEALRRDSAKGKVPVVVSAFGLKGVKVETPPQALRLTWDATGALGEANARAVYEGLTGKLSRIGRPHIAIKMHLDETLSDSQTYTLKDGELSITLTRKAGKPSRLSVAWNLGAARDEK